MNDPMKNSAIFGMKEWKRRIPKIRHRLYDDLVRTTECGPFDGGCVVMAHALQSVIGGTVMVLTRDDDIADHAFVAAHDRYWDYDGPLPSCHFIRRFNRNEMANCTGARAIQPGDLLKARELDTPDLHNRLVALLREILPEFSPEKEAVNA